MSGMHQVLVCDNLFGKTLNKLILTSFGWELFTLSH